MFRLSRSRRAGPHLEWKVRFFAVGAVLGLAGIYLDEPWLTVGAIVVLVVGALLRFLPGAGAGSDEGDETSEPRDAE